MTKRKKIVLIILIPIILIIAYSVILLAVTYKDFVKERMSMDIQYENGKTTFVDKSLGFSFEVNKKCRIDSNVLNEISGHNGTYWGGKFICEGVGDYISFYVLSYDESILDGFNIYKDYDRVYWAGDVEKDAFNLRIVDRNKEKIFRMGGGPYDKEIWQDILVSIKEI